MLINNSFFLLLRKTKSQVCSNIVDIGPIIFLLSINLSPSSPTFPISSPGTTTHVTHNFGKYACGYIEKRSRPANVIYPSLNIPINSKI